MKIGDGVRMKQNMIVLASRLANGQEETVWIKTGTKGIVTEVKDGEAYVFFSPGGYCWVEGREVETSSSREALEDAKSHGSH